MKRLLLWTVIALIAGMARPAHAAMVVIVNKANPLAAISKTEAEMIYLGKKKLFEDGEHIAAADLPEGNPARHEFFATVLKKTGESYRLYWVRMIFSGKGHPPVALKSEEEAVRFVAGNRGGIAFIDSSNLVPGVKAIPVIERE